MCSKAIVQFSWMKYGVCLHTRAPIAQRSLVQGTIARSLPFLIFKVSCHHQRRYYLLAQTASVPQLRPWYEQPPGDTHVFRIYLFCLDLFGTIFEDLQTKRIGSQRLIVLFVIQTIKMYSTANRCAPLSKVTALLRELCVWLKVTSIEPSLFNRISRQIFSQFSSSSWGKIP